MNHIEAVPRFPPYTITTHIHSLLSRKYILAKIIRITSIPLLYQVRKKNK